MSGADPSTRDDRHGSLVPDERAELDWLRAENTLLRTERDMLLRLATEFARDAGLVRSVANDTAPTAARGGHHEDGTMRTPREHCVWLTQEVYEQLRTELVMLRGERDAGADGRDSADTAESDAEYITDANRRHSRIQQIQDVLSHAVVGETPADDGIAEPGMVLTIRFEDEDDPETFLLGAREGEAPGEIEVYSPDSPLGAALIGAREGDERSYSVPGGTTVRVILVRAVPYGLHGSPHPG
ncbi:GreA/GreB family elongation factor [Actinopolyspora halophila]|uniref:GreA/GreB family elongation factor n=1 Tax=Actinopolyspora halophila TaxID=1850 RepID=UPI0003731F71|nr:GreA/GreB family elongation factor [Actinopolyspora halophila]